MLLALDVGNTQTVMGLYRNGEFQETFRVSTHPIGTADEFMVKLLSLFSRRELSFDQIGSCVVSSVVPDSILMLREVFHEKNFRVITHESPFRFRIGADPPEQVGADRLVNAEAATLEYGTPVIVVDSGTATTLCAIDGDGVYRGGAIMPGIEVSIETLARRAARLFRVELDPPERAIGSNTGEALQSGVMFGYASMIDGMIRRFKDELGSPRATVVATGGVAKLLNQMTNEVTHYDPNLTLKGIASVYETLRSQ